LEDLLLPRITAGHQSAVQGVFVDLWQSADRFNPLVAEEITFVAMIARRRVIDTLRRRKGLPQASAVDASAIADLPDPAGDATVVRRLELGDEARLADERLDQLLAEDPAALKVAWKKAGDDPAIVANRADLEAADGLGDVVWSPERQQQFLRFRGLVANDPSIAQSQLWIFDAERNAAHPVDGGVVVSSRERLPLIASLP
jgi:hypothetical protein